MTKKSKPTPKRWDIGQEVVILKGSKRSIGRLGYIKDFEYLPRSRSKGYRDYVAIVNVPDLGRDYRLSPWDLAPTEMTEKASYGFMPEGKIAYGKKLLQERYG